ncbi:11407_t:CDS:1 [Ambispora leptoticha]|uniref:11407_t:CDS:1 n=1 Tax=Ambispora leptoticha TaxID=144679 RepID=A0A9N9C541_9GLOM|nr:11407_t:CDS:1 [Ambispora leptoticha]
MHRKTLDLFWIILLTLSSCLFADDTCTVTETTTTATYASIDCPPSSSNSPTTSSKKYIDNGCTTTTTVTPTKCVTCASAFETCNPDITSACCDIRLVCVNFPPPTCAYM